MFSKESLEVVKTIQSILSNVHTEHGVVDVFGKYRTIDVLASIIALSRLQRIVVPYERSIQTERNGERSSDVDIKELAHYAKYAHAAYGWTLDLALRWKVHFGGNNQALIRLTGIHRDDIVKAEWNAKAPHRPAYFIVRDHARRTIVLCIRGTWSVNDMLTNLYCTSSSKDIIRQWFYREISCHSGMLEAAKAVYSDAESTIFGELLRYPEYSLVLTGHSLGGGCAALLGKLLENRFPTLKVYLFGAPCVVPERNSMTKNVVSVIVKGDPFSCLSLGHVADVSTGIEYLCNNDALRNDILFHTRSLMNGVECSNDNNSKEWCTNTMNMLRKHMTAEKLYPPGRILLLHNEKATVRRRHWWWRWRRRWRNETNVRLQEVHLLYFRDLMISANMFNLSKHLPSMYVSMLSGIIE
jgi:Lipase (class 3)